MPSSIPILVYSIVALVAIGLLYYFGARAWYWHALAFLTGAAIGVTPIPPQYAGPVTDVAIGATFFFLMIWGLLAPAFRTPHHHDQRFHRV